MKIIDNKKDFYDYMSGLNGIDDKIIYDRRKSIIITPGTNWWDSIAGNLNILFDKPSSEKFHFHKTKDETVTEMLILEAGLIRFFIKCEYIYTLSDDYVNINPSLIGIDYIDKSQKKGLGAISLFSAKQHNYHIKDNSVYDSSDGWVSGKEYTEGNSDYIWKNTWIPSVIPANLMWDGIYMYLSSKKDKPIKDNRTDVQKLESFGFDKKTSFRNM